MQKIKELWIEYRLFVIAFIIGFLLTWMPIPYYVEGPGGLISLGNRFSIEGKKPNHYSLAYVSSYRGTILEVLLSLVRSDYDVYPESKESGHNQEVDYRDHLLLDEANDEAILYAYHKASKEVTILSEQVYVTYLYEEAKTDLEVGDQIISVEGTEITSKVQLATLLQNLPAQKLKIEVVNKKKKKTRYAFLQEVEGKKIIGILATSKREMQMHPDIDFTFEKTESGSSGGFMTSLAIYDLLTEEDISKGLFIAGTGTIDLNGNVGEIGGIQYKILGALKEKVDIFFVPKENYEDAIKTVKKKKATLNVVAVSTFDEALDYLKKYEK